MVWVVWWYVVDHVAPGQVLLTLRDRQGELTNPRVQRGGRDVVLNHEHENIVDYLVAISLSGSLRGRLLIVRYLQ